MTKRYSDQVLTRLTQLHPKIIDLSLDRIERLLTALGDPHLKLPPVVHVAGTNGKGSTTAFLRAFLEAAGYRVHVYTSPHLVSFSERIRLAGRIIAESELARQLEECEAANDGAPITYFEITTAAAFKAFAETPADIVLLEVGMGGRVDATNVVPKPALTVITPISMDHMGFLGDSLAKIAYEKATIQKPGVPSVVGWQEAGALAVIEAEATRIAAPVCVFGRDSRVEALGEGVRYHSPTLDIVIPKLGLAGAHQHQNIAAALAGVEVLRRAGFDLPEAALVQGAAAVEWPGRMQTLTRGPVCEVLGPDWAVVLDGGHNQSAGQMLAGQAEAWKAADGRELHLIYGMLNSKAIADFLKPLVPHLASARGVAIPGEINSLSAAEAAAAGRSVGIAADIAEGVVAAARALRDDAPRPGRLLIAGSLYLAGHVLAEHR